MEQNRIIERGPLHQSDGSLANPGYATSLLFDYRRSAVPVPQWRLRECDHYLINDNEYAVCLTLANFGLAGVLSATIVDWKKKIFNTARSIIPLPRGSFNMSETTAEGVSEFQSKRVHFRFETKQGLRKIRVRFNRFKGSEDLHVEAVLDEEPQDSMVTAIPWKEDPKAFHYSQKIIGMRAQGSFRLGLQLHGFRPESSFALLDWGRGVWTYDNSWFWAGAHGWQDEKGERNHPIRFGLNFGYGLGDSTYATENMVLLDDEMHKVGKVDFAIPKKSLGAIGKKKGIAHNYDLMKPWSIKDFDGQIDLIFMPKVDRFDYLNLGVIVCDQHQIFGTFSGVIILDGHKFIVHELKGSAKVVHDKY